MNIIKARPLNDRIFRQLCRQNEEDFERLLFHTEVRWLSKGNCIARFYALYESVVEFLKEIDSALADAITSAKHDVAYLCDFFEKMNEMNLKLQGQGMNLIRAKGIVLSFMSKLTLFKQNLGRHELHQFPKLLELDGENRLDDNVLEIYCLHLDRVKEDMLRRFKYLNDLAVPEWIIEPFLTDVSTVPLILQEDITDLKNDVEARTHFQILGYEAFWIHERNSYPSLWKEVKLFSLAFSTSYMVEKGFSALLQILTKNRNRMDMTERGDLRLLLSNIEPDIRALAQSHHSLKCISVR